MQAEVISMLVVTVIVTAITLALVVVLLKRWREGSRSETLHEDELRAMGSMRCPRCGVSMKPGLAIANRGLLWRDGSKPAGGFLFGSFRPVPNTMNWSLTPRYNRAWRCEGCQTMLVDIGAMVKLTKGEKGEQRNVG